MPHLIAPHAGVHASFLGAHTAPEDHEPGDGCLVRLIRIPVRIVVLLVVVPVRMVWDVLVVCGRPLSACC
ncbi:hypothetical protein [Streptomyces sp. NPDC003023]|uniref:hypothetical protein n=1 Tax=Streptomyces sp. NPDC003023 TaxID=3364675 RepID=UPI003686AFAB